MCPSPLQPFTYDDLAQIQREEKKSNALAPVRPDLYRAIAELMTTLHGNYMKLLSEDPDSVMCEGARMRVRNADTIIKMIVSVRAQKICLKALRSAEGGDVGLDSLTPEERELYLSVLESDKKYLSTVQRLRGKTAVVHIDDPLVKQADASVPPKTEEEPAPVIEEPVSEEIPDGIAEEYPDDDIQIEESFDDIPEPEEVPAEIVPEEPPQMIAEIKKPSIDMMLIRIVEDLPPFVGPDRDYELCREDVVTLPTAMANALINSQKAVKIDPSP